MNQLSDKKITCAFAVLFFFFPFIAMSIDIVAPSLPAISHSLHTSSHFAKNLITVYLIGYSIGVFFLGFISDAFGRKKIFLVCLVFFCIASFLPTLWPTAGLLLICRILQGIGMAAYSMTLRAMIADLLTGKKMMKAFVLFSVFWGLGPILGPILGGYFQDYFGWQTNFYFLATTMLVALLIFSYTIPNIHSQKIKPDLKSFYHSFFIILSNKVFIGMTLIMGFSYALLISFNTLAPFIIQQTFHRSAIFFGHIGFLVGISFLVGTFLCRYLIQKHTPLQILKYLLPIIVSLSIVGVVLVFSDLQQLTIIIIFSAIMALACGIYFPSTNAQALSLFQKSPGIAVSVLSTIVYLVSAAVGYGASLISIHTAVPLFILYFLLNFICFIVFKIFVHK